MNQRQMRTCRRSAPRQALHSGTAVNDGSNTSSGYDSATPIVPFLPGARQAVARSCPLCPVCRHRLALPYVMSRQGLRHMRCLTAAERQVAA